MYSKERKEWLKEIDKYAEHMRRLLLGYQASHKVKFLVNLSENGYAKLFDNNLFCCANNNKLKR